jgi:hypothetical protein
MRGLRTIVLSSLFAVACGGASDSPPKPLSSHFDGMYIAAIPVDQQKPAFDGEHTWNIAKAENAKADADLNEATTQLGIARNEQKAAQLTVDSAVSAKKSADTSADTNRINNATKDLHTAEDLKKAADARVSYIDTYRNYMLRYQRYTQENMYWREAEFESAKANLAKQNNIAPKGVSYDAFPKQVDERQKRTQGAKEKAEADKAKVMSSRENWLKIQATADGEAGRASSFWDPMAPKAGTMTGANVAPPPAMGNTAAPSPQ